MSWVALVVSQAVAFALGAAIVARLIDRGPGDGMAIAGCGYALGAVGMTLILRLLSFAGITWTFWLPTLLALAITAALAWPIRNAWRRAPGGAPAASRVSHRLATILWVLIAVHVALAFNEALLRPLFPWDAAAQWATKARVWFEHKRLVPFVDPMTWIVASGDVFTDAHPTYPRTIPLLQVWAALAWGSFDDAVANVAWPLLLAALALGVCGQLRRLDFDPLPAAAAAYAIVSLPLLDVHAALAGYADLAVAVFYVFAFLALARWLATRTRADAALALACAAVLPTLKMPGWIWLATLPAGVLAAYIPRRTLGIVVAVAAALLTTLVGYASRYGPVPVLGYAIGPQPSQTGAALVSNLFLFANWHLLGVLVPLALIVSRRVLLLPSLLPLSIVAGSAVAALGFVYFFTNVNVEGVNAYTTLNRAALHIVPVTIVYAALALREWWRMQASAQAPLAPVAA
jgi:hypothetical protein